uniref:Nucleoside diphosphate kinase n=2 Tax=Ixodes ricinus TaxID=34613 RepID=V5GXQ3_IXORI
MTARTTSGISVALVTVLFQGLILPVNVDAAAVLTERAQNIERALVERTFIMAKPDAVKRGLVGEIIRRFERRGFKLVAMKFVHPSKELFMNHYEAAKGQPFFKALIEFMSSGPVVPMVWEGREAVKLGRAMIGYSSPLKTPPGTIRGDFTLDKAQNVVHGSDSIKSAEREINIWFKKKEMVE